MICIKNCKRYFIRFMRKDKEQKIRIMREGGKKIGTILQTLLDESGVGTSLTDIEARAQELIRQTGGTPSFQTVSGYHWATCLCVNDEVVHGIPKPYLLKENDVLTIDIGLLYQGYHTDTAWTKKICSQKATETSHDRFLDTGEKALWEAINVAHVGNRIGHISQVIQKHIEGAGYSVVKSLVGHGVGKKLHEDPQIPGFQRGAIDRTPELTSGMTIAIEVIYAEGKDAIETDEKDGWTIRTRDHSRSAVFEHSIGILDEGSMVLTKAE